MLGKHTPPPPVKSEHIKWVKKDIPIFTVPKPVFDVPESVQTPFAYFKRLFTEQMIEHINDKPTSTQTGASVNATAAEIEDFFVHGCF